DPELERRHRRIVRLHALLRHCRDFDTERLVTETGSLSPVSPWAPYPPNRSPEAWAEFRLILSEALEIAAEHGVQLLLKPEPAHVLASFEDVLRLRNELPHPNLGFVLDPASLLLDVAPAEWEVVLPSMIEQLAPCAPLVHAKDICCGPRGLTLPP